MTYGLKYLCEYRSKMRGKLLYRIEIEERDTPPLCDADAFKMLPYDDVFSIKQGGVDDPEYTAIKGSSVTLKVLCTHDMEYLPLFTTDPQRYRVTIYEFREDAKGLLWRGFLAANSYKEEFARPPYVVALTATDGLSLLTAMPFRDAHGAKRTGMVSVYDLLSEALGGLNLELPVCDWVNIGDVPSQSLRSVYIDQESIYNAYDAPTWRDVLDMCTQSFAAQIFQADGVFHVRRIVGLSSKTRPVEYASTQQSILSPMWDGACDVSAATDLSILAPYKSVVINRATGRQVDESAKYYQKQRWAANNASSFPNAAPKVLSNRVLLFPNKTNMSPEYYFYVGEYVPDNYMVIDIALTAYNANAVGITVHLGVEYGNMYWSFGRKTWVKKNTPHLGEDYSKSMESSDVSDVPYYYPLSKLKSQEFELSIQGIPDVETSDKRLVVTISGQETYIGQADDTNQVFISDIKIDINADRVAFDRESVTLHINSGNSAKCEWSTPITDGGYTQATMPVVLSDGSGVPVVSWLSYAERGTIMDIAADDVRRVRSSVARQLDGELRCPRPISLNSLFLDGKFTNAVYYVNSLELLASRQVYKVQLRELPGVATARPFAQLVKIKTSFNEKLVYALHGTLVFRVGADLSAVELYDVSANHTTRLPYTNVVNVRKGLSSIVVQVGVSDMYAIDNVGNVLSHLAEDAKDSANMATALYDADRQVWVSYTVLPTSQTRVVVFNDKMEEESNEMFRVVATGLSLMSNGYILQDNVTTYWHNYALHAPNTLLSVTDPIDPMHDKDFATMGVSDALVVRRGLLVGTRLNVIMLSRRNGYKFRADNTLHIFDYNGAEVSCNNALCTVKTLSGGTATVEVYDAIRGQAHVFATHPQAGVVVCGACVYVAVPNDALYCYSLEDYVTI